MTMRQLILRLAKRTTGVATDEVPGHSVRAVQDTVSKLVRLGLLHKAGITRRHMRYFADPGLRDAMALRIDTLRRGLRPGEALGFDATGDVAVLVRQVAAPPRRDAPCAAWRPDSPPVITERTVFTLCPPCQLREGVELPYAIGLQRGRVAAEVHA